MPLVSCDKCGKRLNAKDEWVGKKLKCPACGATFLVGSGAAAPARAPAAGSPAARASADAVARAKKRPLADRAAGPAVSLNWGFITLIAAVVCIGVAVFLVWWGPIRNQNRWNSVYSKIDTDVRDIVIEALKKLRGEDEGPTVVEDDAGSGAAAGAVIGLSGGNRRQPPEVKELGFIFTGGMSMSFPEWIPFKGMTSDGPIEGRYNVSTGHVEFTVTLGGMVLPTGIQISEGNEVRKVEGWLVEGGAVEVKSLDGQPLQ